MLQIAVTGKPNVGKSSFFNSATLSEVEVANYPFTTIDANAAIAYVTSPCPCGELEVTCNPRTGKCEEHIRYIPVELIDVAGDFVSRNKAQFKYQEHMKEKDLETNFLMI